VESGTKLPFVAFSGRSCLAGKNATLWNKL
jgi:hypothetical protein